MLLNVFMSFFKIGAFTIGGGYAMLPLIEQEFVVKKRWVSKSEMIDIFAISQSFPGVIAINASLFVGYKIGRIPGACIAAAGMIVPSFLVILLVATVFTEFKSLPVIQHALSGVRAGITAIILVTAVRLAKSVLKTRIAFSIAIGSFLLMAFFEVHPIVVIILSGFFGVILYQRTQK